MKPRSTRSRRSRRRILAAPFVMTTALGACVPGSGQQPAPQPQPQPAPATYNQNGDPIEQKAAPESGERPAVVVNPPPPGTLPDPPKDGKGDVVTRDDGTCWYITKVSCPAGATCNPPPPMQVKCPADDS